MKKNIILVVLFLFVPFIILAQKGTMHVICNIDRYSNIAESCSKDFENFKAKFTSIAADINIPVKFYDVDFSAPKTRDFIKNFKCTPDDVVIYYYSGHGFRFQDQDVVWPYLCVSKDNSGPIEDQSVSLNWVHSQIIAKNPRLSISIGDCCNSLVEMNEPKMSLNRSLTFRSQNTPAGYKKLFLDSRGSIVCSGSIPGQYSLGTSDGGMFTNGILEVLTMSRENASVSWKSVFAKATEIAEKNSDRKQRPHFMIADNSGKFYSEGKYPDNGEVVDNNQNNNNNNNNGGKEQDNYTDNNENIDDQVEEQYDNSELEMDALYSMGMVYLVALSSDDGTFSQTEDKNFYDFFNSTMNGWGYEANGVDVFIDELYKWIESMDEQQFNEELENSLKSLNQYYEPDDFNTIVIENPKAMVDNPDSQDFIQILELFKTMSQN